MHIIFIQAGGTIDKTYNQQAGTYNFTIATPAVESLLSSCSPAFTFTIQPVLQKDSLDMNDDDRQLLVDACIAAKGDKIIITHGTDTMTLTAAALHEQQSRLAGKTVVLTGAARPAVFINSDAPFNIGVAVGAVATLPEGIYIAMQGNVYPWDGCEKESETGRFLAT